MHKNGTLDAKGPRHSSADIYWLNWTSLARRSLLLCKVHMGGGGGKGNSRTMYNHPGVIIIM